MNKLSAVVISYNRESLIGTCLRGLWWADELILVDKSSTDRTPVIAAQYVDRVISVPWSPTVEETRAFAIQQCSHDWILYLDDDECLTIEAIQFIREELKDPRAPAFWFMQMQYVLGQHDQDAYYWPERKMCFFHRDSVTFSDKVHDGLKVHGINCQVPQNSGIGIHHLSHANAHQWIEKTNRYTSRPDRTRVTYGEGGLAAYAKAAIEGWAKQAPAGSYVEAVAVLRALYDIVDLIKIWEEDRGLDGEGEFQRICVELEASYDKLKEDMNGSC